MNRRKIILLFEDPIAERDGAGFTSAQVELYNFLLERTKAGDPPSVVEMVKAMKCKSPLPIESRLSHLQEKGALQIIQPQLDAA